MNLKKKILCGVLASSFVFGGLVSGAQTFAMIEESAAHSDATVDPSVNTPDYKGYTPLMRAIEKFDVEKVRELLAKGASLEIPKLFFENYYSYRPSRHSKPICVYSRCQGKELYSNAFEFLCDLVLEHDEAEYDDGSLTYNPFYNFDVTAKYGESAKAIAKMLLEHCVKHNIQLSVNDTIFYNFSNGASKYMVHHWCDYTVWRLFGRKIFNKYMNFHRDLFEIVDRPFSYIIGDALWICEPSEEDEIASFCSDL